MHKPNPNVVAAELTRIAVIGMVLVVFLIGMGFYATFWKPNHEVNLAKNVDLWERVKPISYTYEVRTSCFCPDELPYTVLVSGDFVVAVPSEGQDAEYYQRLNLPEDPLTIGKLFEIVRKYSRTAANIDVEYDALLGYPTMIRVDHNLQTYDDEVSYEVAKFMVLGEN